MAVAVTNSPAESDDEAKVKETLPLRLVLTVFWPRKVSPSPKTEGSASELEKNWMVKFFLGRLLSLHLMLVAVAEVMTGKFCSLFGPQGGRIPQMN